MLSRNPKRVSINFWRLKLGIFAVLLLLFTCSITIFTWYPFVLYSNLSAAFIAIAAFVIFIIVWKFIKVARIHDIVLNFLHGILACSVVLAVLIALMTPILSQRKQIASASLSNQQFQLLYTESCLDICSGSLKLYRCDFFGICPEFDETSAYVGWIVSFWKIKPALWEFNNKIRVVSLSIDPTTSGINVSYDGTVVYTFKSP